MALYKNIKSFFSEDEMLGVVLNDEKPFPTHLKYCEDITWEVIKEKLVPSNFIEIFPTIPNKKLTDLLLSLNIK